MVPMPQMIKSYIKQMYRVVRPGLMAAFEAVLPGKSISLNQGSSFPIVNTLARGDFL